MNSQSAKLATISNFIGQHQEQQQRQSMMIKHSMNKTIKQRRKEDRASERRSSNSLVHADFTQTGSNNKKNISKLLLQTSKDADLAIQIIPETSKDYPITKRGNKNAGKCFKNMWRECFF